MMRILWTGLIALLTLYAPLELTRVIILLGLNAEFLAEIVIVWTLYAGAIFFVYKLMKAR